MQHIRVLYVDDDPDCREAYADGLSDRGFSVQSFPDGGSLLASPDVTADADVIVLDWALPDIAGIDLLSRLRRDGVTLPVVFLTAYSEVTYESRALAQGAADFIDKLRGAEVVATRLRLIARGGVIARGDRPEEDIGCGKLTLKPAIKRAYLSDVDVNLTITEYNIVELLVSKADCYVTYRAIYDRMHYEGFIGGVGDRGYRTNVRSFIRRLRRKFCKLDPTFSEIQTSYDFGYRWRAVK